ncbi:MAG: ATP-binding protein [Oscillospiraceae bacterium]|nr:ATP-binding protein [Oscillospiraceae bacterium]
MSTYSRAIDIINNRRIAAKTQNENRIAEVEKAVPEIAEVNRVLSQSSINILRIITKGENVQENMKQLEKSNLQAQEMVKNLLVKNGYPKDYLDLRYTCSRCSDTGFCNGVRCSCLNETAGKLAVQELNQTSPLKLSTFDTFNLEYYRGVSTASDTDCFTTMSNNLDYCRKYTATFSRNTANNVFITGKTGLGKTHLSLAIAERLLSMNWNVVYGSSINLMDRIESEHFGRSEGDTLGIITDADLLIIDDLGTEYDKQFCTSTMYNIINTRLNKNIPTIISTNLSLQEIEVRYEPRIVSRIVSHYDILKFSGNDVRQMIRLDYVGRQKTL